MSAQLAMIPSAYNPSVEAFLTKPFGMVEFLNLIQRTMAGR